MDTPSQSPFVFAATLSAKPWGVSRDTALVIEDNDGIARLLIVLLEKCGLQVIWCQSSQQALEQFTARKHSIALVISDCRVPDGDAREICQIIREQLPEMPLLLTSGSATCLNLGPIKSGRLVRFMAKPYSPCEMLGHVEKLQAEAMLVSATNSAGFV